VGVPASQTLDYTHHGYLELRINPIDEPENVYFTEQRPKFEIVVSNKSDRYVTTKGEGGMRWILGIDPTGQETIASGSFHFHLDPGEEHTEVIEPGLLAYESNAVMGVTGVSTTETKRSGKDAILFDVGIQDNIKKILYTFTIWDRSHYDAVHEQPKKLQKWVVYLSVLVVVLAVIQLGIGLLPILIA
jgi:hypothetical protein